MMKYLYILPFIVLLYSACLHSQDYPKTKGEVLDLINRVDSLFSNPGTAYTLQYYAVDSFDNLTTLSPAVFDDLNTDKLIKLYDVVNKNAKAIKWIPFSESGDWHQVKSYYYDRDKHLVALKNEISFFEAGCMDDDVMRMVKLYVTKGSQLQLVGRSYFDRKGIGIPDISACILNYPPVLEIEDGRVDKFLEQK